MNRGIYMKTAQIKNIVLGQGKPKICVPLMGKTDEELIKGADDILAVAKEYNINIVEFRGDYYNNLGDLALLKDIMKKLQDKFKDLILLFTIRSYGEGGEKLSFETPSISEINTFIVENRLADMVDVELFSGEDICKKLASLGKEKGVHIIMSNHDFKTTPSVETMVERLRAMQTYGADIAKIAVMPETSNHVIDLLKTTAVMRDEYDETPVVAISMGRLGAISRIAGEVFGSAITFATVGEASAPGQLTAKEVNAFLNSLS